MRRTAKRIALMIAATLALFAGAGWLFRDAIGLAVFSFMVTPGHAFTKADVPPAPDYADSNNWAALPGRHDLADYVPEGAQDNQARAAVDVFYVTDLLNKKIDSEARQKTITDRLEVVLAGPATSKTGGNGRWTTRSA